MNDERERPLEERIRQAAAVLRGAGAREVYVLGSVLSGKLRRHSDVDIAVVGLPPGLFFRIMGEVWDILGRPVDLIDLDKADPVISHLRQSGELQRVG